MAFAGQAEIFASNLRRSSIAIRSGSFTACRSPTRQSRPRYSLRQRSSPGRFAAFAAGNRTSRIHYPRNSELALSGGLAQAKPATDKDDAFDNNPAQMVRSADALSLRAARSQRPDREGRGELSAAAA